MYLLQFGAERITKALSLRAGSSRLYWEPIIGILVETDEGWVLLETGMGRAALDDPAADALYAEAAESTGVDTSREEQPNWHLCPSPPAGRRWTWGLDGDPMATALADIGLAPENLSLAAISHLHIDHSGGIPGLARAGVPIAIQQAELEFANSDRAGPETGYYEADWIGVDAHWRPLDGDARLAPGVWALSTPGHTPGHMSYRIDLPETGSWVFTVDASDLGENLYDEVPPGTCVGGTPEDEANAERSLKRLIDEALRLDARLIPGHDQLVWNAARHPRGGHR
jgi:N-acyl homoserine lactone hydrolase